MSLSSFPVELVQQVISDINDFAALIAFSQTCTAIRQIMLDDEALWNSACHRAGFSKSLLHEQKTWRELACAINHHGTQCTICSILYDVEDEEKMPKGE